EYLGRHLQVLTMTKLAFLAVLLFTVGCKKGDGLVVVTLTATPTITNIASLHVTMTVGNTNRSHDIAGVSMIDNSGSTSFGIDVSADYGSSINVQVQALSSSGTRLGSGSGTGSIAPGKQANMRIAISGAVTQGGGDMATAASNDLAGVPQCTFDNQNLDN